MKTIRLHRDDYTRYMTNKDGARHEIKKSLFDEWGPVRIAGVNGRFVGIVREDPGTAPEPVDETSDTVSTAQMDAEGASMKRMKNSGHVNRAPSPKGCRCKDWPWEERPLDEKQRPVEHHPKCAFKRMWERQTGTRMKTVAAGPTFEARVHPAGNTRNTAIARPQLMGKPDKAGKLKEKIEKIPMPDNCPKCSEFTKSRKMDPEQHHPTCMYYKKYLAISTARAATGTKPVPVVNKNKIVLYDLSTQEQVREAEADEVETAKVTLRDTGMSLVEVDGDQYLVMYEDGSSLEPAEGTPATSDTEPPTAPLEVESEESGPLDDDEDEEQVAAPV